MLEQAKLIRVVRTRKVRAITEMLYGRVARLFVLRSDDESKPDFLRGGALSALVLRQAADELLVAANDTDTSAMINVRLTEKDRRRFEQRLNRLVADLQRAEDAAGERHVLAYALFRAGPGLPPRGENGA